MEATLKTLLMPNQNNNFTKRLKILLKCYV